MVERIDSKILWILRADFNDIFLLVIELHGITSRKDN